VSGLLIVLLVLPLGAAFAGALGRYWPRFPLGQTAGLLALAAGLVLLMPLAPVALASSGVPLLYEVGGWSEPVGIALYLDGLAWLASAIGLLVAFCALLYAVCEGGHPPGFYFFFLLLIFGMQGVILTGDLFNLFVFQEILSLSSYILIADRGRPRNLVASFRYLLISSLALAFFLLGIFLLYRATGTLSLRMLAQALAAPASRGRPELELAVACLLVGAGVKAAFLPFQSWLPEAHAAAPHAVSAVLSGVIIKVSFLVVWRLLRLFAAADLQAVLLWVGVLTAVAGVGAAVAQLDAKRLLAFSSVSQVGYIVAAFGAGAANRAPAAASFALGASLYHLLSHSLFKSLLFLVVGTAIHLTGERDLRRLGGLARRRPALAVMFLVGAFGISGLPPFNGFVSKGLVNESLKGRPLAYALILLAGAGTLAAMLKLSGIFFRRRAALGLAAAPPAPRRPSPTLYLPMGLLAALCLGTGLLPGPVGRLLGPVAAGTGQGRTAAFAPSLAEAFSPLHLLELGGTVLAGSGLYLLATRTPLGHRLLDRLRGTTLGLNSALALVVAGLLGFVLLAWLL
jgi:multicomponent Na+:H+ antiporter subunit D